MLCVAVGFRREPFVEGSGALVELVVELGHRPPIIAVLLGEVFGSEPPAKGAPYAALPIDLVPDVLAGVQQESRHGNPVLLSDLAGDVLLNRSDCEPP